MQRRSSLATTCSPGLKKTGERGGGSGTTSFLSQVLLHRLLVLAELSVRLKRATTTTEKTFMTVNKKFYILSAAADADTMIRYLVPWYTGTGTQLYQYQ